MGDQTSNNNKVSLNLSMLDRILRFSDQRKLKRKTWVEYNISGFHDRWS